MLQSNINPYLGHSDGFDVLLSASLSDVSVELGLDVVTDVLLFNSVPIENVVSSKDCITVNSIKSDTTVRLTSL